MRPRRPEPRDRSAPPAPSSVTVTSSRVERSVRSERDAGGVRVLRHVRQRLGADEVGGHGHFVGRAEVGIDVQLDGHRASFGEFLDGALQSGVQLARVQAASDLAQVGDRVREVALGAPDMAAVRARQSPHLDCQRHDPLFHAVMEAQFESPALLVGGEYKSASRTLPGHRAAPEPRLRVRRWLPTTSSRSRPRRRLRARRARRRRG